ncbi:MAG: glycosyltransferase [Sphingobacteriales bacterium]|nr:glycosyltransferase [Sphingobacteriales bacterium]
MLIQNKKLHIVIELNAKIPAVKYGGTERVVWDLGKALTEKGHRVTFLVAEGSFCDFAEVRILNNEMSLQAQIPDDADVVHLNARHQHDVSKPYLITIHGNSTIDTLLDVQSVFVSQNHAERYGSSSFVHNGLDWRNYPAPDLKATKSGFHFLGRAAWKVKNLKSAINITKKANEKLEVLGGYRFNLKMGWRFTFDTHVSFKGMVDNHQKAKYLQKSKGLIFPVLWHEPFGLALIESLYYGCPVFGTPYGSLAEIITKDFGFLSDKEDELVAAIKNASQYDAEKCHEYAKNKFSAQVMADEYLKLYEKVMNGEKLNNTNPQLKEADQPRFLPYYS